MGQYYIAYNLDKKESVQPGSYHNGRKLTEHSYIGNDFVAAVEFLLIEGGRWAGNRIVWSGDYSDALGKETGDDDVDNNFYMMTEDIGLQMLIEVIPEEYRYILNLDTEEYVDKKMCPSFDDGWRYHPLPLLTAEGNGRGGGDYHRENIELVGRWSRNKIIISNKVPEDFIELKPDFYE